MNAKSGHRELNPEHRAAYDRMLERARQFIDSTDEALRPRIYLAVEQAKDTATELGELTRDEADLIGAWLKRDLEDAAAYLKSTRRELRDWLRFDLELIEDQLADLFANLVDHTRLELEHIKQRADAVGEWRSGEVTGPGTLICKQCGEMLHFHNTAHIPPCSKCKSTRYRRSHIASN
jgi:hypothetical protein